MRHGRNTPFLLVIALILSVGVQAASGGLFSFFRNDEAEAQSGNDGCHYEDDDDDDGTCWFCPPSPPIRPIVNAIGVRQQAGLPEEDQDDADLQSQTEDLDARMEVLERDLTRLTLIVEAVLGNANADFRELIPEEDSTVESGEEEPANGGAAILSPTGPRSIARPPAPPAELEFIR